MSMSLTSTPACKVRGTVSVEDQRPLTHASLSSLSVFPPEIVGLVAKYLSRSDLATCTQVSRGFRRIWPSYLFHEVYLTEENHLEFFDLASVQKLFVSNCQLTRSFTSISALEHGELLRDAKCCSLQFSIFIFNVDPIPSGIMLKLMRDLTSANACLEHVALHGAMTGRHARPFPLPVIRCPV